VDKTSVFRERARDCRLQAEKAFGLQKEQWLKAAEEWERLVKEAEQFPHAFR
jgi:hypothetical protein